MRGRGPGGNSVQPPQWDDLRFPFTGQRIDTSAGRVDYDYTELGIGYQSNALYPTDVVGMICQMHHRWKLESTVRPHLHWFQNANNVPNWLLAYRKYKNGDAIPASWTLVISSGESFTYSSGTILQITTFGDIDMTGIDTVSDFIDFKLYRDTNNVSTLFAGADPYSGTALAKEFDIHYQIDSSGSNEEYVK